MGRLLLSQQRRLITVTISGMSTNPNVRTLASSPTEICEVTIIVEAAGLCIASSTGNAGLRLGAGWAAGTSFSLINRGRIYGAGGTGGDGGGTSGTNGSAGGDAIWLDGYTLLIDNGSAKIHGGGGGGGGGGGVGVFLAGGGGGGQGYNGGGGGTSAGNSGAAGSESSPGLFGDGQVSAGRGGYGGGWGSPGEAGQPPAYGGHAPGAGGAAGRAIYLNGGNVIWVAGNNPSQVRGAVA